MASVIGDLRVILGLDSAAFQQGLRNATTSLRGIGQNMQRIGQNMTLAVTGPLAGFGGLALKSAGDFEASMNRVQAALGASAKEMTSLEAAALKMGETTQFRASQAADAIEILAKNGLDASQILGGALEASMLLAASSGAELADAGDLATDVMLQFGKKAEDLTGLVDGMTGALLESKFGFDDYRLAIAQAGGVAGGLGVEFEDFNAVIAGTSALFASGSDAGTSYKTFLQRLVPASGPAADAIRELGLEFFNADGSMKSMAEVAEELRVGLAGLSDEAKNDALSTIFGTDALRTAIGLAEQGADGINRLKDAIGDASATEQAEARMAGFNGEMLKLKSAIEALMLAIANSGILERATKFTQEFTAIILRIKETNPELLQLGVAIAAVTAALGPVVMAIGLFAAGIAAIGAPVAAAIAGIVALGVAIYAFKDDIVSAVESVQTTLANAATQALEGAREIVRSIIEGLKGLYEAGVEAIRELARGMRESVTTLIADAASWGRDIASGLTNGIKERAGAVRDGVKGLAANVKGWFTDDMEIQSPSRVFHRFGGYIAEGLQQGIEAGGDGVQGAMQDMAAGVSDVFKAVLFEGASFKDSMKSMLGNLFSGWGNSFFQQGISGLGKAIGLPFFARGGFHAGGLRIVGENGPELEATGPARYFSAAKTRDMMAGSAQNLNVSVSVDNNGNLHAFVRDQAGQVVAQSAPQIVGQSVGATRKAMGKSKRGWGI